jgi:class 3 adenylate cyclase
VIETEPRPPVRAIVASFLFTDLVGFSKGTATEQYAAKAALSACLRSSLSALRETDYWIKDTGDGALIAFVSNPEHALYMALAIAQDYGQAADRTGVPLNGLRTGLHLGTVKETIDIEARPNYIGDGINATKRIMDFAAPGQIAASRSFFEAVANLDTEYAALFQHVGAPDDKHGRAHELYAIAPSATVLKKLRLELVAAAPPPAESGAKSSATIGAKRDSSVVVSTESRTPLNRAAEAVRMRFNPLMVLIVLIAFAAAIFLGVRRPMPAAPTVPPVTAQPVAVPMSAKGPVASPTFVLEPAAPAPISPVIAPRLDEAAPVGTTQPAHNAATNGVTPPVIAAPTSGPKTAVDSKPRTSALPAAPVRIPVAPDRGSSRCSHIVEKAALGEPLSHEEQRELANSCR